MTERIYICKLENGSRPNTKRPVFYSILGGRPNIVGHVNDGNRYNFWIGIIDTNSEEHAALIASANVRHIPNTILNQNYSDLTNGQKNAVDELGTFLGFNFKSASVKNMLFCILGRTVWETVKDFS